MDFDKAHLEEKLISSLGETQDNVKANGLTWLNINGLHDVNLIKELGDMFSISPLFLEDILNTD